MLTESTLLLFGLFMIAAAAGWGFARYMDRQIGTDEEEVAPLSPAYLRALNLLLDQKTDKALDLFVRMVATDDEALDTHFALGALFRRRGEMDRAIRIHQNILARSDLSDSQRAAALFALGEDYLKAGLLDRAENIFLRLSESADDPEPALHHLIGIHETLGDWQKAIDVRRQLEDVTGTSQATEIGHCFCELAEAARARGEGEQARQWLKQARGGRKGLIRAIWLEAGLAAEGGDLSKAWRLLVQVVRADTALLPALLPELLQVAETSGNVQQLDKLLRELLADDGDVVSRLAYAGILADRLEPPVVYAAVRTFIASNETLARLVDLKALCGESSEARAALQRIANGLRHLAAELPRYRCTICGYSTQRLVWQCPKCKAWETSRPITDFPYQALLAHGQGRSGADLR